MVHGLSTAFLGSEVETYDAVVAVEDFVEAALFGGAQGNLAASESLGHARVASITIDPPAALYPAQHVAGYIIEGRGRLAILVRAGGVTIFGNRHANAFVRAFAIIDLPPDRQLTAGCLQICEGRPTQRLGFQAAGRI